MTEGSQPEIIYQDKDVIAVNKPAGLLVHKTAVSKEPTLVDWLLGKFPEIKTVGDPSTAAKAGQASSGQANERPGIVHRLDKETSGVIVVARNQKAFDYLKKLFQTRQIKKTYLALVWGTIKYKSGVIEKPLGLKTGSIKRTTRVEGAKMVKEATTVYKVIKYVTLRPPQMRGKQAQDNKVAEATLLEVQPLTGRTHQIRVHLASIGHPVVGDTLYSKRPVPPEIGRMFLHAESIELTLPNGSRIKITADLPPELNPEKLSPADLGQNN